MSLKEEILKILPDVRRPSRYLGNEKNAVRKDLSKVDLKIALCYPDTYEIGMSNIGLSILYHLLNHRPDIACERVYAPWIDMEQKLRATGLSLTSLESSHPIRDFDIVGISLPYELTYTNILTILDLAGIPFYAKDRDESYPLIVGGGTGAFNPEPVADFFDAIVIGDGEEVMLEICEVVKQKASTRFELLKKLAQLRGVYIPSFFDFEYNDDGTVRCIIPLLEGYTGVRKRTVSDLDAAFYPDKPIVPHTKVIHDRVGVEVQRGCVRGCRFCQAGYIYRPERQRSPETVKKIVRNQLATTGQEEVSLVSLSIGDYDCITPLLKDLMDEHGPKKVGISLPATRVEQLTPAMMSEIKRVRKTGFTIAPEAATERMRNVINKGNSEENLLTTTRAVFSNGWSLMKFYFMIGLPTETDEDVAAIADLGYKCLKIGLQYHRKAEINLGVSPFVPKPFTPYQWVGQIPLEECHRRLDLLRSQLKSYRLHLKPHRPEVSYLEGIFSRGDRRLSSLIVAAWQKGCRFDEWDECLRFESWREAWTALGIDPTFYVERERGKEETLPWDHLFVEMEKGWLWEEYQASLHTVFIDDCSTGKCTTCGVCDYKEIRNRAYELPTYDEKVKLLKRRTTTEIRSHWPSQMLAKVGGRYRPPPRHPPSDISHGVIARSASDVAIPRIQVVPGDPSLPLGMTSGHLQSGRLSYEYLCTFSKTGPAIFLSHLEFVDALRRTVSRAQLPVRFSEGFHPLPSISFGPAMPVGREMRNQLFTIKLEEWLGPEALQERLNRELPEGIVVEMVTLVKGGGSPVPRQPSPAPSPPL